MTGIEVTQAFSSFVDQDGKAMTGGYIYIGQPNTNPETNAIPVFWDDGLTIPAAQPIRTIGGYPSRNGSPGRIFAGQAYSISVRTSDKTLVYTANNINKNATGPFATVADMLAAPIGYVAPATLIVAAGDILEAAGFRYQVAASATAIVGGYPLLAAGGAKLFVMPQNGVMPMLAFGPTADGTTNDKTSIDKANQSGAVVDLGGKSYEYGGVFTATASFINGQIIDDNRIYDYRITTGETAPTAGQRRARLNYSTSTTLRIDGLPDAIAMAGFRIFGQYLKSRGRLVSTGLGAASHATVSISTQLIAITSAQLDNWYGVFACANSEDATVSFRLVPFLRAFSRAGNVVTLGHGGENRNITPATATYTIATNAFAGADCLVIQHGGVFSGRRTTITANSTTTVTLADGTDIAQLDFLLPAPVGFDDYCYLGAAYYEAPGEWRNIADAGSTVQSRMVTVTEFPASGLATNAKIRFGGCISPLAVGYIGSINATISTASTGLLEERFAHDSSLHDIKRLLIDKDSASNLNYGGDVSLAFSKEQAAWFTVEDSGGIGAGRVSATLLTYGWVEP
jgi:hypothetical protein